VSGIHLAKGLVADRPDLKVILISGYSEATAGGSLDLPPWAHFLPKPFGPKELRRKIRETMPRETSAPEPAAAREG
jgi:two-component system, cell cycle sensor histidine kinase and response regulator CckA